MRNLKVWLRKVLGLNRQNAQVALPTMVAFWDLESYGRKEPKCFFRTFYSKDGRLFSTAGDRPCFKNALFILTSSSWMLWRMVAWMGVMGPRPGCTRSLRRTYTVSVPR